ncbi:hypothetical protein [Bathycoccus sp. RCC716 virus 3]|nr:hypothetical protein [Bathycoccus sp. RCC716 virus 3]
MPCCDTGRNVQKYKGGGGGASTLQEALENGNIATVAIELQSNGLFIGDGGGLSNIAGVGGSVGNMQQVTTSGATTSNKIILTNTNESLETSGNINVGNNKFYLGDGGLLSNTASTVTLQQASNQGNVINNTVSFTNAAESIVTTGKIVVGTSLEATNVNGNGSGLSSLNASNVSTGTLHNDRLSTKTGTGNIVMSANPTLSGTITGGTFSGTHDGDGSGLSSLNASNVSSGTIHNDRLDTKTGTGNIVMSANPTLSGTITGGTFSGTHDGNGSGLSSLNASNVSSGTLSNDRLSTKTGTGNIVMSANPTLSGTITGGTFSGTHDGNGSGLSSLNASNVSTGTLSNDRLSTKTGTGNIVMSANPTLSGTITGGTFSGTHDGNGSGLSSLNASNVSTGTIHNDRLSTKTGTGNIVMSASPTLSGTITGGTFSGTHDGNGSGLSSLNASNVSTGTLSNDRLGTVPYNKGGTGQTSYTRGDIVYSDADNSLAKLAVGTESGMFLRSDGTDVSWSSDGSRLTNLYLNDANVNSTSTLSASRGGTGLSGIGTYKLLYTKGSANTVNELAWNGQDEKYLRVNSDGSDLTWANASGSGGTSGQTTESLTATGWLIGDAFDGDPTREWSVKASVANTTESSVNHLVARQNDTGNVYVGNVIIGTNVLSATEWSGESSTVTVGTDNSGNERDLAFLNGNSILKDDGGKLTWKPNPGELYIGPSSGTRNTLTNTTWSGESAKVTINNTTNSSIASPVLMHEADGIVRKDTSNRLTWTATGTHAGTLTIGLIGGTHSNITSTTFTGTATKVTVNNDDNDTDNNTLAIPYVNGTDLDSKAGTFHYTPNTDTVSAAIFSGTATKVTVNNTTNSSVAAPVLMHEAGDIVRKDTSNRLTWTATGTHAGTLTIGPISGTHSNITSTTFTGTATKVTVNNDNNDTNTNARAIPYVNGTDLDSKASTFHYTPNTGTLTAAKFSGDGSGLSSLDPSALSSAVGSALGGTGQTEYTAGDILYANNDTTPVLVKLARDNGKFLKSTSTGVEWSPVSASTVPVTDDTTSTSVQGITFAASTTGSQTIKSDQSTLHYKPSTGTLTTSNLITSGTSQFNGIANTAPDHTLSVGTVVSIQETSTGDVLIVRGNGFFNNDVYIAKKLTMPAGSTLVADTIKVRSHNVKETMVVAERPESQLSA